MSSEHALLRLLAVSISQRRTPLPQYRFDIGVSVRVSVPEGALVEPGELVGPFIDWFDNKVHGLVGTTTSDERPPVELTVEEAWREGIGELFLGDETERALLSF